MAAITVKSTIPETVVLVDQAVIDRLDVIADKAHLCPLTTLEEKVYAESLLTELRGISQQVETKRQQLKAPVLDYGRSLDAAAAQYQEILKPTIDALGRRILAFVDQENRKREEARRAAEAEAAAKQKEADAKAEAERAAAKKDLAPWEEPPAPTEYIPERVVAAPVAAPIASSVVKAATGFDLVIDDETKVPFEVQGVRLYKEVNRTLIKKLMEQKGEAAAILAKAGCRLVPKGGVAMKGGAR